MLAAILLSLLPVLHEVPDQDELRCLANTVYNEARGEPLAGQLHVMDVVLNRVEHENFPDTICGVVNQRAQFASTPPSKRSRETKAWKDVVQLATMRLGGLVPPQNEEALFFYNPSAANPGWAKRMDVVYKMGGHHFLTYRAPKR